MRSRSCWTVAAGAYTMTSASLVAAVTIVRARIRGGVPEWTQIVGYGDPSRYVHRVFADSGVLFAVATEPEGHRAAEVRAIVEPVGQLELHRAPVDHVHHRIDAGDRPALDDAAQKRLVGRACLGRVQTNPPVHGANRCGFARRSGSNRGLGPGQ